MKLIGVLLLLCSSVISLNLAPPKECKDDIYDDCVGKYKTNGESCDSVGYGCYPSKCSTFYNDYCRGNLLLGLQCTQSEYQDCVSKYEANGNSCDGLTLKCTGDRCLPFNEQYCIDSALPAPPQLILKKPVECSNTVYNDCIKRYNELGNTCDGIKYTCYPSRCNKFYNEYCIPKKPLSTLSSALKPLTPQEAKDTCKWYKDCEDYYFLYNMTCTDINENVPPCTKKECSYFWNRYCGNPFEGNQLNNARIPWDIFGGNANNKENGQSNNARIPWDLFGGNAHNNKDEKSDARIPWDIFGGNAHNRNNDNDNCINCKKMLSFAVEFGKRDINEACNDLQTKVSSCNEDACPDLCNINNNARIPWDLFGGNANNKENGQSNNARIPWDLFGGSAHNDDARIPWDLFGGSAHNDESDARIPWDLFGGSAHNVGQQTIKNNENITIFGIELFAFGFIASLIMISIIIGVIYCICNNNKSNKKYSKVLPYDESTTENDSESQLIN